MDEYPPGSLDHNVPLLVVSGLTTDPTKPLVTDPELKEQGILIRSEVSPLDTPEADIILRYIQERDASTLPWNPRGTSRKYRFKVKTIGRVCSKYYTNNALNSIQILTICTDWPFLPLGILTPASSGPSSRRS